MGIPEIDSILNMYLALIGNVSPSDYTSGTDSTVAFGMFILMEFTLVIVFMNMLIAIMADTFTAVSGSRE